MWPTWWWPQEFMQPEMLSDVADVVLVVEVVEAGLDGVGDGDRLGVGEAQKSPPGQQMMSVSSRCWAWPGRLRAGLFHRRRRGRTLDVGETRFARGGAQFAKAVGVGQPATRSSWSAVMSPGRAGSFRDRVTAQRSPAPGGRARCGGSRRRNAGLAAALLVAGVVGRQAGRRPGAVKWPATRASSGLGEGGRAVLLEGPFRQPGV